MWDMNAAMLRLGNDAELLRSLMIAFVEEAPRLTDELARCAASGDWAKAGFAAHNLRGPAANLGAAEVKAAAKAIEELCDRARSNAPAEAVEVAIAALREHIEHACDELAPHLARGATPGP